MRLKKYFTLPIYDGNEEKTYQAILLNTVLWASIVVLLFIIMGNLIGGKVPISVSALDALALTPCLIMLFLLEIVSIRKLI